MSSDPLRPVMDLGKRQVRAGVAIGVLGALLVHGAGAAAAIRHADSDEPASTETLELSLDQPPVEHEVEVEPPRPKAPEPEEESIEKDWFILKVQSNREASIRDALARRVQVAGLDRFFGDIIGS